ncbi:hypothetical protein ALC57_07138, partial [Trachymyrmex cornetzi]
GTTTALATPAAPPTNDPRTSSSGRTPLLLCFQAHTNLRFGLHSCPNGCGCGSLSESRITRGNVFPRLLSKYIISRVSFGESVAMRIRCVVLATRSIQWINTSIVSGQSLLQSRPRTAKLISGNM